MTRRPPGRVVSAASLSSEMTHPTTGPPRTALVVVNYGSHRLLERNLAADIEDVARVVIVDNLSSSAERDAVSALAARHGWELVAMPDNRGFGAGCNAGVARADELGCDVVVLLNPDAVASAAALGSLRARVDADPTAIVCPWIVTPKGAVEFGGSRVSLHDGRIRGLHTSRRRDRRDRRDRAVWRPWLTGACLALRVEVFQRLDGFDPRYFLYWEDVDLSYRAVRAGYHLVVAGDVRVVHDEGGTHDAGRTGRAKSTLYYYYNTRNRLLFAVFNLPRRRVLRWIAGTPAVSWEILMRGGRRQLLESRAPLCAAVRGSLSGCAAAARELVRRRVAGPSVARQRQPEQEREGG